MIGKVVKKRIIDPISIPAVTRIAGSNPELKKTWEDSLSLFPDFKNHYSFVVNDREIENRIRLLVVAETTFVKQELDKIMATKGECTYADVGDSDGSVRLLLKNHFTGKKFSSVGINLQRSTVEKLKSKGLDAICADALTLGDRGIRYDIVSAFETLEHLPDPVGFLNCIKEAVGGRLVLSVPFVRRSRIGLAYLSKKWPKELKPTIENTHIFELSPRDWKKLFLHTGWRVDRDWKLMMYPSCKLSRLILQPFWRIASFEGFWFLSLYKDSEYASKYTIE